MTLQRIINRGRGTTRHWRVENQKGYKRLYHFDSLMAIWRGKQIIFMSIGHGSFSDQGGMNILFRELNAPYYYTRRRFPQIVLLEEMRNASNS